MVKQSKNHLVSENFSIDEDELEELSETTEYWERSSAFYEEVKGLHIDDMTVPQMNWLTQIEERLE